MKNEFGRNTWGRKGVESKLLSTERFERQRNLLAGIVVRDQRMTES